MSRDAILVLENDAERVARFAATLRAFDPVPRLVVWASARRMLAELDAALPTARLVSLDHDLEPTDATDPGDGLEVAKGLAARPAVCPVLIQSCNARRSDAMAGELELGGWPHRLVMPLGDDWIEVDWRRAVRRALRGTSV